MARWFLNIWSLILEGKNTCALISFNANVLGIIFFGLKCPAFSDTFIQTLSIKIYQVFVVTCLIFTDLIKIDKREMLPCSISLLWFLDQRGYIRILGEICIHCLKTVRFLTVSLRHNLPIDVYYERSHYENWVNFIDNSKTKTSVNDALWLFNEAFL